jgi:hypothetical protein
VNECQKQDSAATATCEHLLSESRQKLDKLRGNYRAFTGLAAMKGPDAIKVGLVVAKLFEQSPCPIVTLEREVRRFEKKTR